MARRRGRRAPRRNTNSTLFKQVRVLTARRTGTRYYIQVTGTRPGAPIRIVPQLWLDKHAALQHGAPEHLARAHDCQ